MPQFSSRTIPLFVAGASVALLAAAHILEAMGMLPCELCLRQREAYWIAIAFAVAAAALPYWKNVPPFLAPLLMAIAAAALLYGAVRAFQHIGVVEHWWASACSGGGKKHTIAEIMAGASSGPLIQCDAAPKFFGVPLPVYNFLAALGLAAVAALVPLRVLMTPKAAA